MWSHEKQEFNGSLLFSEFRVDCRPKEFYLGVVFRFQPRYPMLKSYFKTTKVWLVSHSRKVHDGLLTVSKNKANTQTQRF